MCLQFLFYKFVGHKIQHHLSVAPTLCVLQFFWGHFQPLPCFAAHVECVIYVIYI